MAEAATAGIVAVAPLTQRGLRALRGMPKWQRGAVDLAGITGGLRRTKSSMAGFGPADEMADTIPDFPAVSGRSMFADDVLLAEAPHYRVVQSRNGQQFIEFDATKAITPSDHVSLGGNQTADTLAMLTADGRVIRPLA